MDNQQNKENFRELLFSVNSPSRKCELENLYDFLEKTDFFKAPASSNYHGNYEGGLVEHSLSVFQNLKMLHKLYESEIPYYVSYDSMIVTALLHDVCKINFYKSGTKNVKNEETGQWQKEKYYFIDDQIPLGHGEKSVIILQQHITLTSNEIYAIRWHMGGFDDTAKSWAGGLALSNAMEKCPLLALLHMADLATNYINKE